MCLQKSFGLRSNRLNVSTRLGKVNARGRFCGSTVRKVGEKLKKRHKTCAFYNKSVNI